MTLRELLLNMGNDTIPEDYDAALTEYDSLVLSRDDALRKIGKDSLTTAPSLRKKLAEAERPLLAVLGLDPGIARYVETLQEAQVETFESCEGGEGHAYPEPVVRFFGDKAEGFRALTVALQHGFPVNDLRRFWQVVDGEPCGPYWELAFGKTESDAAKLQAAHDKNIKAAERALEAARDALREIASAPVLGQYKSHVIAMRAIARRALDASASTENTP